MTVKSLVTGGSGFLGRAIVDAIHEHHPDWEVSVLDIKTSITTSTTTATATATSPAETTSTKYRVSYHVCDVTSLQQVHQTIRAIRPTLIIHAAGIVPANNARYGRSDEARIRAVNVDGTRNVVHAARECGVKALVYTSSCTAVTDDLSRQYPNIDERWPTVAPLRSLVYGESKVAAERLVLAANKPSTTGLATACIRPPPIVGPGDETFLPAVVDLIDQGVTSFCLGDGLNLWDLAYVTNVADAHVLAAANLLSEKKTAAG